jgi:hypothetical protein
MRVSAAGVPTFARSCRERAQQPWNAPRIILCLVLALLFAPAACVTFDECRESSCEDVLNQAQDMILATGADAMALAERASLMLSSSNFSCCRRFPPISIRSALVRQPHPRICTRIASCNTWIQIHGKAESVKREFFASAALLLPLLPLRLAPNQLGLAAMLLRANAAAVKLNGDQEDALLWLTSAAQALARDPHPMHSWMLPGVMNDAANRHPPLPTPPPVVLLQPPSLALRPGLTREQTDSTSRSLR